MTYSKASDKYGEVYGLKAEDFTIEQLKKIKFEKLIELLNLNDIIIDDILIYRMQNINNNELVHLTYIKDVIKNKPKIIDAYNNIIKNKIYDINRLEYYRRAEILNWELLNDENKLEEFKRWTNKEDSIISVSNIDLEWLYKINPVQAETIINQIIEQKYNYINHLISIVPEQLINQTYKKIFSNNKNKHLLEYVILNKNAPESFLVQSLRYLSKRIRISNVKTKINKNILNKIPSISRLEVVELLFFKTINFDYSLLEINEVELKDLLFSCITRYPERVEKVIKKFRSIKNINTKESLNEYF